MIAAVLCFHAVDCISFSLLFLFFILRSIILFAICSQKAHAEKKFQAKLVWCAIIMIFALPNATFYTSITFWPSNLLAHMHDNFSLRFAYDSDWTSRCTTVIFSYSNILVRNLISHVSFMDFDVVCLRSWCRANYA